MAAEYDAVLASFYQAAITREQWPEALQGFASLNASRGTNLVRCTGGRLDVLHSPSLHDTLAQFVEEGWHLDDYRARCSIPLIDAGFVADQHIIAPDDVARSDYYSNFARPAGVPWYTAAGVVLPDGACLGISLQRSDRQGAFAAGELRRLNAMLPRLREILLLAHRIGLERQGATLAGLDLIDQAAILFDRNGLICGMNKAAEALVGQVFSTRGRQIVAIDRLQRAALTERIASAVSPHDFSDVAPRTIRLRDSEERAWLGQIAPVDGYAQDIFRNGAALLILTPAHARARKVAGVLGAAFGLTPREASVAELLVAGLDTNEIADRLSLSRNAVRFHIKSILPKADVQRQAEFVAAAAQLLVSAHSMERGPQRPDSRKEGRDF
jgi:DNA-binding CsgD family transcriptional regulator